MSVYMCQLFEWVCMCVWRLYARERDRGGGKERGRKGRRGKE